MTNLIYLVLVIVFIIIGTTRLKIHPFLALLVASLAMGFFGGLDSLTIINSLTEGFGQTLKNIGIVIALGTIIGVFMEKSGGANTIAEYFLKLFGKNKSHITMSITGFIVSIPVFCDSGFIILSTLNKALNRRTGISLAVLSIALATGLYTTHVFIPPTPGPLAAAAIIGADVGLVLIMGIIVSIPVAIVGLMWASFYCSKFNINVEMSEIEDKNESSSPSIYQALLPIFIPIILISIKSIVEHPSIQLDEGIIRSSIVFIGHPVVALMIGVTYTLINTKVSSSTERFEWVSNGLLNCGSIILITGAGGAFGHILRATDISASIGQYLIEWNIGIVLPFIIAAFLKTALGSSTVAIITTAAMIVPLLDPMGYTSSMARSLIVLSIGSGAMTVSHLNDSYFWVVSQFSNMDTTTALRCHTLATLLQGITGIIVISILSFILL
ncbi:MAG TPA: GntP family permease [Candidatus Marinimicrobia bacterium]|jgi:GntP family gluconate:H+ symporter|nr:GntP family permease [Candidatus Neomarinimicrobiota bacterium]HJL75617.1 GntP family permease [Candidatus Neomarinimicrobiota bacterium]HJM70315.1 GntP family permease [Candidatus Neomarinimicrobiota bacterium]|tara:strand:- start:7851 stop:9173 length:1323 start_codon:yes stop_codon:yes gene_type:complete